MPGPAEADEGFTLIEVVLAILLLAIVMTALAPAYYGMLRAAAADNSRSQANSLAVSATEAVRSIPYYEVGYNTTPAGCPTTSPVVLPGSVTTPLTAVQTWTRNGIKFSVLTCVNWVDSSISGYTQAYKQAVVTVSWKSGATALSISQTSAIYPGGEAGYCAPQNLDLPSGITTTTVASTVPYPGYGVSAGPDKNAPSTLVDVSWTAPCAGPAPASYEILFSPVDPHGSIISCPTPVAVTGTSGSFTAAPGTTYYIQVESFSSTGHVSTVPSNTATVTTAAS